MQNKILQIINISLKEEIPQFEEFFNFCITKNIHSLQELFSYYEEYSSDIIIFWNIPLDDDLIDSMRLIYSLQPSINFIIVSRKEISIPTDLMEAHIIQCKNHAPSILTEVCNIAYSTQNTPSTEKDSLKNFLEKNQHYILALIHTPTIARYRLIYSIDSMSKLIEQIKDFLQSYRPRGSKVFSIDSDLFAILFLEGDTQKAYEFIKSLDILRLEHGFIIDSKAIDIEMLIGLSEGNHETLLPKAYNALKIAQENNQKCSLLQQSDEDFLAQQQQQIYWMKEIHHALTSGRIVPYYQPILNNHTGIIEKYETLVRLIDDCGNVISPGLFLHAAKESGLMNNITMAVINKSFSDFKDTEFEFSINISTEGLQDRRIVNYLLNRSEKYNIPTHRILIEILEEINSSQGKVIEHINELHSKGFKIAIDDFGTENSNFGRLIDMKADYIKIDGSFVKNVDHDERSYKIVHSIAKFAKSIGAKSVAEFVHSEKVYRTICDLGVDYSQGYLFGQPSPEI